MCENVLIEEVQVRNPSYAQNGDGLDLESCKNALIVNSTFDVGDDGICLKSGKDEDGRRRGRVCENVMDDSFASMADSLLQKDKPVAVYCRSGNRSKKAAAILSEKGYKVFELDKGFNSWQEAGKEIEK